MNNTTEIEMLDPPTHLLSDYIEMIYLSVVVLIGIPSNIVIFCKLLRELKQGRKGTVKTAFVILKIHLNVTDILLLVFAFGKLMWLTTYEWVGGDLLCRFFQFFCMFSLYSSSNIIVCVALDRLRNVFGANKVHANSEKATVLLLTTTWIYCLIISLPQLFLWQTFSIKEYGGWVQCTDVWQIHRYGGHALDDDSIFLSEYVETAYNILHLILVFWGPLLVLIVSYTLIATRLMKYSVKGPMSNVHYPDEKNGDIALQNIQKTQPSAVEPKDVIIQVNGDAVTTQTCERQVLMNNDESNIIRPVIVNPARSCLKAPAWHSKLRGHVFKTSMLVILTHFLFWFPYNALGLMKYVNYPFYEQLSTHASVFKDLQILITLINPFIYGFGK